MTVVVNVIAASFADVSRMCVQQSLLFKTLLITNVVKLSVGQDQHAIYLNAKMLISFLLNGQFHLKYITAVKVQSKKAVSVTQIMNIALNLNFIFNQFMQI